MSGLPKASLPDLTTMAAVYDDTQRPKAHVPLGAFDQAVAQGQEVEVQSGLTRARGRVVRMVALVEVDLSTVKVAEDPRQGRLA